MWSIILLFVTVPFLILAIKTKFKLPKILSIIAVVLMFLNARYMSQFIFRDNFLFKSLIGRVLYFIPNLIFRFFHFIGLSFPYFVWTIAAGLYLVGIILGFTAYCINVDLRYKQDKSDTSLLIKTVRDIWWPMVIFQIIFALISFGITVADGDGTYGNGSALGIPGIVLGLVFFSELIKKKTWARIALGILGVLGIILGFTSLPIAFNFAINEEFGGMIPTLLGILFSMGWGIMLIIIGFGNNRIKTYVSPEESTS